MPQEGKSSTAANVARALAGAGERVIVLDCDLRRPTQHVHFGLERDHGLTNFLSAPAGTTDWSTYLKRDPKIPSLHVLTCGPIPPNPPDLLGSERFAALIRELRSTYDWVVIDSPPAASLADATLLSAMAEMVVIVVRHNSTDRDLVSRSVTLLRNVGANVIGAVLNNIDINRAWRKDHYYAGYYNTDEGRGTGGKRGGRGSGPERAAARSSV
jgi:capsular exopolysaccharide synthesis family protein